MRAAGGPLRGADVGWAARGAVAELLAAGLLPAGDRREEALRPFD